MLQSIKKHLWVVFLAGGLTAAWAYSLIGPGIGGGTVGDAWQVPAIGYGLNGDVGTPKAFGQEYRRNTPVMVYAMNANFLTYYGSNGVAAVDGAYAILNSLTNVSSYSPSLSEFPLTSQHFNYTAQSLFLTDLKSTVLGLMVEQLGLADPVRYVWTLRDRASIGQNPCPQDMEYFVVQRSLDVTSPVYSPYINGTLFTYSITENCAPPNPLAQTVPVPVDPYADIASPVASLDIENGTFYSGLTRDDVAGLRYLLSSNNILTESPATGSTELVTNASPQVLMTTLSFNTLAGQALTNDPATLQTLYPGLVIVSSSYYFTNILTPNIVITLKQVNGQPAGTFKTVVVTNGFTPNYSTNYTYVFGNLYTNSYSAKSLLTISTTSIQTPIGSPVGTPGVTNDPPDTTKILVNQPGGDFFILPAGWCGFKINQTLGTQVMTLTNSSITLSNVVGGTNVFSGTQVTYTSFTNHTFVITPSTCTAAADAATLRMGIENIKFVKANFDSLLTQTFQPITNYYRMVTVSNSQPVVRYYRRIVTAPDFLFTGTDQSSINNGSIATRNLNFNQANILPGLAGPGTINPSTTINLNTDAPIFETDTTSATIASETNQVVALAWGSFDASTNDPVVYPDGTSIANLQNQILARISPPILPAGTNNVPYQTTTFTMTGGSFQAPFTWSLLPPSVLPQGLSLSAGGTISGTPANNPSGIYDFIIQVTDSLGRTVNWSYSINIPQ